jgi:hypothetical protein
MRRAEVREEAARAVRVIEEGLGIPTWWSGRVIFAPKGSAGVAWVNLHYDIVIYAGALRALRRGPMIGMLYHEAAHTFSRAAGMYLPEHALIEEVIAEIIARRFRRRRSRGLPREERLLLYRMDREDAYARPVAAFRRLCYSRGISPFAVARELIVLNAKARLERVEALFGDAWKSYAARFAPEFSEWLKWTDPARS